MRDAGELDDPSLEALALALVLELPPERSPWDTVSAWPASAVAS